MVRTRSPPNWDSTPGVGNTGKGKREPWDSTSGEGNVGKGKRDASRGGGGAEAREAGRGQVYSSKPLRCFLHLFFILQLSPPCKLSFCGETEAGLHPHYLVCVCVSVGVCVSVWREQFKMHGQGECGRRCV